MTQDQKAIQDDIADLKRILDLSRQNVPGWVVRKALPEEVSKTVEVLSASSNPGEHLPYILPDTVAVVCVTEGSVEITPRPVVLIARDFFVLTAGQSHCVRAISESATIMCMFFRPEGDNNGSIGDRALSQAS